MLKNIDMRVLAYLYTIFFDFSLLPKYLKILVAYLFPFFISV